MNLINELPKFLVFWSLPCDNAAKKVERFVELTLHDGIIMG